MTVVLAIVVGAAIAAILTERALTSRRGGVRLGALMGYAAAWLVLFPVLFASGILVTAPRHGDATFSVVDPVFYHPEDRLTATVEQTRGDPSPPGTLWLTLTFTGERFRITNPDEISRDHPWLIDVAVPNLTDRTTTGSVRLFANSSLDPYEYTRVNVTIVPAHVPVRLELLEPTWLANGNATFQVTHSGGQSLPPGALRLLVTGNGTRVLLNVTSPVLNSTETWSAPLRFAAGDVGKPWQATLVSVHDGFEYGRRNGTLTPSP